METIKEITCICCPAGCPLSVSLNRHGAVQNVSGNQCVRGARYGSTEAVNPQRIVTALVCIPGCIEPLSVKTETSVPKDSVRAVANAIGKLQAALPVRVGDVICEDILGTGVAVVATKDLP